MSDTDDLLADLTRMRLTVEEWTTVEAELRALDPADPDPTLVSQTVFAARVQQRFHAGRASSTLPPTKQTSALPWVGLACALLLLVVGGLLGGGLVFVVVVALSVGVFAVAFAGSRVAHRSSGDDNTDVPDAVPMPASVERAVAALRHP